jgi:hypothetical protein
VLGRIQTVALNRATNSLSVIGRRGSPIRCETPRNGFVGMIRCRAAQLKVRCIVLIIVERVQSVSHWEFASSQLVRWMGRQSRVGRKPCASANHCRYRFRLWYVSFANEHLAWTRYRSMTNATDWCWLSGAGFLVRSAMSSCQRSRAASLLSRPLTSLCCLPLIFMYHYPLEQRNQGCALRDMNDSPNPVVLNENNVVDWKSPLQLPVRLVPGREAFFRQLYKGKVQRKVQIDFLLLNIPHVYLSQAFSFQRVTSSGRTKIRTWDLVLIRDAL